jgi:hypothetical protein
MCAPAIVPIALSLGASIAGGVMQSQSAANNQIAEINAQNDATKANLAREQQYQTEANQVFQGTLKQFDPNEQAQNLQTSQAGDTKLFAGNAPTESQIGAGGVSTAFAPKVVQDSAAEKVASRIGKGGVFDKNAGTLAGYGSSMLDNSLGIKGTADNLGTISDFARNNASLAPLERSAAMNNAYKAPSPLGSMLSTLGGVGMQVAGSGGFGRLSNSGGGSFGTTQGIGELSNVPAYGDDMGSMLYKYGMYG